MKSSIKNLCKKLGRRKMILASIFVVFFACLVYGLGIFGFSGVKYKNDYENKSEGTTVSDLTGVESTHILLPIEKELYDAKMNTLANNPLPPPPPVPKVIKKKDPKTGKITETTIPPKIATPKPNIWPVKDLPYPNAGALLPFNRIVAYYGNLYSRKMGVLGEYDEAEMLAKLDGEVKKWEIADPETPVIPALHYIAVVAQSSAGADGKYRARMPHTEIDKVLKIAEKRNAIVFLDLQVAFSDVKTEIPLLEKYLKLPNVHLGIDPEFSMKSGIRPGKIVGTMDGVEDVSFAINYLKKIVKDNKLPPKILIVHRYTQKMLTNYKAIKPDADVQVVINMDGWGSGPRKLNTYKQFVYSEPVQFAGFKLFYKNDLWEKGSVILTPENLMKLNPRPIYIQYQ